MSSSPQPSFADVPKESTPVSQEWMDAVAQERTWFRVQIAALSILFLAVLQWQRTTPNIALEAGLCIVVGLAAQRHSAAGRARARLTPLPVVCPPSSTSAIPKGAPPAGATPLPRS